MIYNPNDEAFDEWLAHPVTKAVHAFYTREAIAHRKLVGYGTLLNEDKSFEEIGREYVKHIYKANLYEELTNLTCDDIQVDEEDEVVIDLPIEE